MLIKIALILSVILQFITAVIALSLVRRTRTNIAWWLISGGFLLMAIRRFFEVLAVYDADSKILSSMLSSWTGVFISILMLLSLIFIKQIFDIQQKIESLRKANESRVLSAILKTEETERQNFAKELHDGLGPLLSSVKMAISAIEHGNNNNKILNNAGHLIDESILALKEISNRLSPHILTNFGLHKALKSFINKLQAGSIPKISLNSEIDGKRFDFNIEVVIYRVVCELISNALKHAQCENIMINLSASQQQIELRYEDDGIGFNEDEVRRNFIGMGYSNIQSRIKSLNGNFEIETMPGNGTKITSTIYLTP